MKSETMTICIHNKQELKCRTDKIKHLLELNEKIEVSKNIIRNALLQHKNSAIAFSGGKDSLVILHLIRQIDPNIKAYFCNTTNEYPETLKFVKTISNLDIVRPAPGISFKQVVKDRGLPGLKRTKKYKKGSNTYCCDLLKEKPATKYCKDNNIDLVFLGITSAESRNRYFLIKKYGTLYYQKTKKIWNCLPIADWTPEDVWLYIDHNKLQYNKVYDIIGRQHRCGCLLCTAYLSWKEVMNKYNPYNIKTVHSLVGQITFL